MNPICFVLSLWLQCDCFLIYLLQKYLLSEPTVRARVPPTSLGSLWPLHLTPPPSPPAAHSCGGQHIRGLLLWSAAGSEADQRPFSSGVWEQQQGRIGLCSTTSGRAATVFWGFFFFFFYLAGAIQHDRKPHQLHQSVQPVLHPQLHTGSHDGPHWEQHTRRAAAWLRQSRQHPQHHTDR